MENDSLNSQFTVVWKDYYLIFQGLFYFAQGTAFAAIMLIPVFMQNMLGVSPEDSIGYQAIIMLPWYIKIIFGVLSDNVPVKKLGRRHPYIIAAGVFGMFGWFIFPTFNEYSPLILITGIFMALSVAMADTVVDSLSVDITPPNRRSLMQGVSWGARGLGSCLAGIMLGILISQISYSVAYISVGLLMTGGCFLTLLMKEPKANGENYIQKVTLADFKKEFKRSDTWMITFFNLAGGAGIAIIGVLATFLNAAVGIDIENLGIAFSLFSLGQFIGALGIGSLGHKYEMSKVFGITVCCYVFLIFTFLFYPIENFTALYILLVVLGAINGGYEASQMAISMSYSVGPISGTMYSWYNSMSNVAQLGIGSVVIGYLAVTLSSYPLAMQFASVFLLLSLIPGFKAMKKLKILSKS